MTSNRKDRTMRTTRGAAALLVTGASLLLPAAAGAHVTLQPPEAPAGGYTKLDVRVPNESDHAATTKVVVQMPDGFASASYQPVAGWTTKVATEKPAQPLETEGGTVDTQVKTITWTATGGGIEPGQFQDFPISVKMPEGQPGEALTFPALQTYDDGDVVRWIGDPDSEEPAPQVILDEPEDDHHAMASDDEGDAEVAESDDDSGDGAPTWLAIVAVVLGAGGLLAGGAALARGRK
jgi:uncharacterized protein YcnI